MSSDFEPGYFREIPYNLQKLVKAVGFADFNELDPDERAVYDRVRHGKCMTCEKSLGKTANFIVTKHGIVAGYCSGVCHTDMAVLGFLQEKHHEIITAIDFRGGGHAQADDTPSDVYDEGADEQAVHDHLMNSQIPDSPGDDPATGPDE